MQAFSALAQAATRDGALDKELIALAFNVRPARRLDRLRYRDVGQTRHRTSRSGRSPRHGRRSRRRSSLMYAADAISAFERFEKQLNVAA
jgi:hypothetical protein